MRTACPPPEERAGAWCLLDLSAPALPSSLPPPGVFPEDVQAGPLDMSVCSHVLPDTLNWHSPGASPQQVDEGTVWQVPTTGYEAAPELRELPLRMATGTDLSHEGGGQTWELTTQDPVTSSPRRVQAHPGPRGQAGSQEPGTPRGAEH